MRIDPDHHASHSVTSTKIRAGRKTAVGTSDFRTTVGERASLEPHRGPDTTDRHLVTEPDPSGRQTVREPAHRTSRTLRPTAAPRDKSQSDGSRVLAGAAPVVGAAHGLGQRAAPARWESWAGEPAGRS